MVLAGFAGTEEQWTKFDPAWKEAIKPLEHLHMRELRFRKDRHRAMLERAGKIPQQVGLMALAVSVDFADYADLIKGTEDEYLYAGYIACLQPMIVNLLRGLPPGETVRVMFERQDVYSDLADMAIKGLMQIRYSEFFLPDGTSKLAGWGWVEKNETPRIEASDYFAFSLLQQFRDAASLKARLCSPVLPSDGEAYGVPIDQDLARQIIIGSQVLRVARANVEVQRNSG